jgi:uncharacterized sporulation protein YeaH/YhbH (DUF444 family)
MKEGVTTFRLEYARELLDEIDRLHSRDEANAAQLQESVDALNSDANSARAESRQTERVTCEGNVIYSRVGTIPKSSSSTTIKQGETDVPSTDPR